MTSPESAWHGRSVCLTGHTGFKGSWLALWLRQRGAVVHGYALDPPTTPSLFEVAEIASELASDTRADLADMRQLAACFRVAQPEVIFHLAAQPLVRQSYRDPLATFSTNVMGTANVLEAARLTESVRAIVLVTTDKVYENCNWSYPYRENDPLGGHDPYSASKAAMEVVVASYRASFFGSEARHSARLATARAGNVIGGGDWADERLVPDCLRSFERGSAVQLRFPGSVRPWQHVLEPLSGYIQLAERLLSRDGDSFARAWNFGSDPSDDATVGEVAARVARVWGDEAAVVNVQSDQNPPEAETLRLDSSLARTRIGWTPRWSLEQALIRTVAWHRAWLTGADMHAFSAAQIADFEAVQG